MLCNFIVDWLFGIMKYCFGEISGVYDVEEVGVVWLYYVEVLYVMVIELFIKFVLFCESFFFVMIIDK